MQTTVQLKNKAIQLINNSDKVTLKMMLDFFELPPELQKNEHEDYESMLNRRLKEYEEGKDVIITFDELAEHARNYHKSSKRSA